MIIGVPSEVKTDEYRVGMRPGGVELLVKQGHTLIVQKGAGLGAGFSDEDYTNAGAEIAPDAPSVWKRAEMIVKVKEPQAQEYPLMQEGQTVFTYFHFAADKELTLACLERKIVAVAYETLESVDHTGHLSLPLLTPMSQIAGRLATQEGAKFLEKPFGGRGVLLGGVPGVEPGNVLVIGGGVVGTHAATIAYGMGARVVILEKSLDRIQYLSDVMPRQMITIFADPQDMRRYLAWADIVIGAVLIPGAAAPKLIRREDLKLMKPGAVIVDVAIDQGGCAETSRVTTHTKPTYTVDDVVHYCVGNMPGAVARTSTFALTNATLPWTEKLARHGHKKLAEKSQGFRMAINMDRGVLLNQPVAEAHGLEVGEAAYA